MFGIVNDREKSSSRSVPKRDCFPKRMENLQSSVDFQLKSPLKKYQRTTGKTEAICGNNHFYFQTRIVFSTSERLWAYWCTTFNRKDSTPEIFGRFYN